MAPTPTFRLADRLLDGGFESYITTRRAAGKSWRIIARELWADTGGEIDVTYETLRLWFSDKEEAA